MSRSLALDVTTPQGGQDRSARAIVRTSRERRSRRGLERLLQRFETVQPREQPVPNPARWGRSKAIEIETSHQSRFLVPQQM